MLKHGSDLSEGRGREAARIVKRQGAIAPGWRLGRAAGNPPVRRDQVPGGIDRRARPSSIVSEPCSWKL
jgi:hypothetical protein